MLHEDIEASVEMMSPVIMPNDTDNLHGKRAVQLIAFAIFAKAILQVLTLKLPLKVFIFCQTKMR